MKEKCSKITLSSSSFLSASISYPVEDSNVHRVALEPTITSQCIPSKMKNDHESEKNILSIMYPFDFKTAITVFLLFCPVPLLVLNSNCQGNCKSQHVSTRS